jgi:hypothetical protein
MSRRRRAGDYFFRKLFIFILLPKHEIKKATNKGWGSQGTQHLMPHAGAVLEKV